MNNFKMMFFVLLGLNFGLNAGDLNVEGLKEKLMEKRCIDIPDSIEHRVNIYHLIERNNIQCNFLIWNASEAYKRCIEKSESNVERKVCQFYYLGRKC